VLLPDHIGEPLRTILSGDDLISHGSNLRFYALRFTPRESVKRKT
jgi:hypothetical protein